MSMWGKKPGDFLAALQPQSLRLTGRLSRGRGEIAVSPGWKVAWGAINMISEPLVWQDGAIALGRLLPNLQEPLPAEIPLALSPSQQFVVIGDVWLGQREEIVRQLGMTGDEWQGSDLQLVSHLWDRNGVKTWQQLVGMFALVVWDRDRQVLSAGRDQAGAYTLYYMTTGPVRWIAPRLRSLEPYRSQTLDAIALRDYLCCAFVPGERTLWQDVREVRPGTVLQLPDQTVTPYWVLQEQITAPEQPIQWHSLRLRQVLEQVVKESLPVAEPVGCFLSGGIDSSGVTALAAQFHPVPVHTFSIHFGAEYPNELEFSTLVAQHCQTQHRVLEISLRDLWNLLPEAMGYLDDPIGDPLTVPNLLLGRMAKQFVNTVLNGEGGDPCFGGPKNQPMLMHRLYGDGSPQDVVQAYLVSFQKCAADLPQLLRPEVWQVVQPEPYFFEGHLRSPMDYLNQLMAMNIQFKGADHILTKVNNLTRATGIQGRSPLFDSRIVELSMQIPPEYKLSGVQEKAVLKQAVADLLPDAIVNRPKSGMMVPVQIGFQHQWQRQAKALLLSREAAIAPYLNQALIRDWLNYRGDTWRRYGVKLWLLASLEYWLQVNCR